MIQNSQLAYERNLWAWIKGRAQEFPPRRSTYTKPALRNIRCSRDTKIQQKAVDQDRTLTTLLKVKRKWCSRIRFTRFDGEHLMQPETKRPVQRTTIWEATILLRNIRLTRCVKNCRTTPTFQSFRWTIADDEINENFPTRKNFLCLSRFRRRRRNEVLFGLLTTSQLQVLQNTETSALHATVCWF